MSTEENSEKTKKRNRGALRPVKRGNAWTVRWRDENGDQRRQSFERQKEAQKFIDGDPEASDPDLRVGLRARIAAREKARRERQERERRGEPQPEPAAKPIPLKSFQDLATHWLEHRQKRSKDDDRSMLRAHLLPAFGDMMLGDITYETIERFKKREQWEGLSPKTLHNVLTLLIAMLNEAVDLSWLVKRPKAKKPKIQKATHREYRWLRTREEVQRFLRATRGEKDPTVAALYATAVLTGLRAGELAGLRWSDVDLDRRQIHVRHSFDGPTKSGDDRIVPMFDEAHQILAAWKLQSRGELVFPSQAGTMLTESARIFQDVLYRVLKRGGFEPGYITFHSLRHTFASHYMLDGGDIYRLRDILGHSDVKITQRYAHLSPKAFEADRQRLSGLVPAEADADVIPLKRADK